jgi:hypothetical protein
VQKPVATDAEVHEGGLDRRLDVDDASLVDIADVTFLASPFDIEFFEDTIFQNGDSAFLGLEDIDEHLFFHGNPFVFGARQGHAMHLGAAFQNRSVERLVIERLVQIGGWKIVVGVDGSIAKSAGAGQTHGGCGWGSHAAVVSESATGAVGDHPGTIRASSGAALG